MKLCSSSSIAFIGSFRLPSRSPPDVDLFLLLYLSSSTMSSSLSVGFVSVGVVLPLFHERGSLSLYPPSESQSEVGVWGLDLFPVGVTRPDFFQDLLSL